MEIERIYNEYNNTSQSMQDWGAIYEKIAEENSSNSFITEEQIAEMVNTHFTPVEATDSKKEEYVYKVCDLIEGMNQASIEGVTKTVSPLRKFQSKKGKNLELRRILLEDTNGDQIWVNVWNEDNNKFSEEKNREELRSFGDHVILKNLLINKGWRDDLEAVWQNNSSIQLIEQGNQELHMTSDFTEITTEGVYHLRCYILFKGEPIMVGAKKTVLTRIAVMDMNHHVEEIAVWRDDYHFFEDIPVGTECVITVDASQYKDSLNLNYNNDYEIIRSGQEPHEVMIPYVSLEDIEQASEYEKVNVHGKIGRVYAPFSYKGGHICSYDIILGEDEEVELTTFGHVGESLNLEVGDLVNIYEADVRLDDYNYINKLNYGNTTIIEVTEGNGQIVAEPISELGAYADEEEYVDIEVLILRKGKPMTYQRIDNTAGLRTRCTVADSTGMTTMMIWGDNEALIQYNQAYQLCNVKVKENFDTAENEIHVNTRTRITPISMDVDEIYETNFKQIDELKDHYLDECIQIAGQLTSPINLSTFPKCPACNSRLTYTDTTYTCEKCNETVINPYYLWKIECKIGNTEAVLWGDVAHKFIDNYVNKEYDVDDQIEAIQEQMKDKTFTVYGVGDYDDRTDKIFIRAMDVREQP